MPKVNQKFEAARHCPVPDNREVLDLCTESLQQWEKNLEITECIDCLQLMMFLGRIAERRFYELP